MEDDYEDSDEYYDEERMDYDLTDSDYYWQQEGDEDSSEDDSSSAEGRAALEPAAEGEEEDLGDMEQQEFDGEDNMDDGGEHEDEDEDERIMDAEEEEAGIGGGGDDDDDPQMFLAALFGSIRENDPTIDSLHLSSPDIWTFCFFNPAFVLGCMRENSTIKCVTVAVPLTGDQFPPQFFDRICRVVSRPLGGLRSLEKMYFCCADATDYKALTVFLEDVRQITSLDVGIITEEEPPSFVDGAVTGHPAIEDVTVSFHRSAERVFNPFPNSLSTIPNLNSVSFAGVSDACPRLVNFRPFQSTSLRRLAFIKLRLNGLCNVSLSETLTLNPSLTSLVVAECQTVNSYGSILCQRLAEHRNGLKALRFSCPDEERFYRSLCGAVHRKRMLSYLGLEGTIGNQAIHAKGLAQFLSGLEMQPCLSLNQLCLTNYHWESLLSRKLSLYLSATTTLESLEICTEPSSLQASTDCAWLGTCSGLAGNTSISSVQFVGSVTPQSCSEGMHLLKDNKTLENLGIVVEDPQQRMETLLSCFSMMKFNKSIQNLFVLDSEGEEAVLSVQQADHILRALKRNYTLEACPFDLQRLPDESSEGEVRVRSNIDAILKLNSCGRGYLLEGIPSIVAGMAVLERVIETSEYEDDDDNEGLDCIFIHVLENPALCCEFVFQRISGPSL